MGMSTGNDEITVAQALEILGYKDRSSIVRLVHNNKLKPSRKLPGGTGTYLFRRSAVLKLAETMAVERRKRNDDLEAKLAAARDAMKASVPS